jgi:hypothetical protein
MPDSSANSFCGCRWLAVRKASFRSPYTWNRFQSHSVQITTVNYYSSKETNKQTHTHTHTHTHTCYNSISQNIFYWFRAVKIHIRKLVVKLQPLWQNQITDDGPSRLETCTRYFVKLKCSRCVCVCVWLYTAILVSQCTVRTGWRHNRYLSTPSYCQTYAALQQCELLRCAYNPNAISRPKDCSSTANSKKFRLQWTLYSLHNVHLGKYWRVNWQSWEMRHTADMIGYWP